MTCCYENSLYIELYQSMTTLFHVDVRDLLLLHVLTYFVCTVLDADQVGVMTTLLVSYILVHISHVDAFVDDP